MGWEILLAAALEAGLGLLAEAGFGDQVRDLKERLTKGKERKRRKAFDQAFVRAREAAGEEALQPLLEHRPFQEAVIAGLLDPEQGFDLQSAAEVWGEKLPAHARALRRFFSTLENVLLDDNDIWGPLLYRYQTLRFQAEVREALQERQLDVPAMQLVSLTHAAAERSVAVAGDVRGSTIITGDVQQIGRLVIEQLVLPPSTAPTLPGPTVESLRHAYLERLVRECRDLPLLGLKTESGDATDRRQALCLDSIYVHLDIEAPAATPGREVTLDALQRLQRKALEGLDEEELLHLLQTTIVEDRGEAAALAARAARDPRMYEALVREHRTPTALQTVAVMPQLVLLGGPGSGKSTFASYLTLCLANLSLPADKRPFPLDMARHLPGWPEERALLPVRVVLREFARELPVTARQGTADHLWSHIVDRLSPYQEFAGELKKGLLAGKVLVVLDGLDEVLERSEAQASPRRLVLEAVQGFVRSFPHAHYLITCRVASYRDRWVLPDFNTVQLADFDRDKQDRFCKLWYAELAARGELAPGQVGDKVAGLQRAVRRPELARMAGNPLLLTVMALVHAREAELPEARALLYEKCVEVLLWRWEQRKVDTGRPADLPSLLREAGVESTTFLRTLSRLAFDVHQTGGAERGEADIRASYLERFLEALYYCPEEDDACRARAQVWARRMATFVRERAGLLVEKRSDRDPVLTFPHRSFQEYLAACWLTAEEDPVRTMVDLARQGDHWWEVVKLAVGRLLYVHRQVAQPLATVDWLCPEGEPLDPVEWRLGRLAGEVLLELKPEQLQRDPEVRPRLQPLLERVRARLVTAIRADTVLPPHERAAAGDTLAGLGDVRFQEDAWHLPDEPLLGFVEVPAGPFRMGTRKEEIPRLAKKLGGNKDWYELEVPQHELHLPPFYIARYPVTVAQFRAFVEESGYKPQDEDRLRGLPHHPVVWVTWHEAMAYCEWLTEVLRAWEGTPEPLATFLREQGWAVTLPSEAEWEKAARGGDGRIFPWGDDPDPNRANYVDTGIMTTSAVGCFPGGASPFEVEDLSGNVWEWTCSQFRPYPYDPDDGREDLRAGDEIARILRGGAFINYLYFVRCAARRWLYPYSLDGLLGFRVVAAPFSPATER